MDSLAVYLQNNPMLHDRDTDNDNDNIYNIQEGTQITGAVTPITEVDRIVGDTDQNGVFSSTRLKKWQGLWPKGTVSELQPGDNKMINVHTTLMDELKKQK